nr:SLC13 family permease [Desulforamulus aquiferis]
MKILTSICLITAVFSAFLDNVTTVMLIIPVTFAITRQLRINLSHFSLQLSSLPILGYCHFSW